EQLHGRWRRYGPWTDLYALGCITWELICGRPPFPGDDLVTIAVQHEEHERPSLEPQFPVSEGVEAWIHRAMAVEPERRFRCAADAAWALPKGPVEPGDVDRAEAESGGRSDEVETREVGGGMADRYKDTERSQAVTLAPTVLLEEQETEVSPVDPARETVETGLEEAAEDVGDGEPSHDAPPRLAVASNPPIPMTWQPERSDPVPARLVGAGLGLFGLREPPFVNRTEACDRIWELLHRVVDRETAEMVFVTGEPGTGKSRLAEWMARRVQEVGAATLVRAVHSREGHASEGLRGALERRFRTRGLSRGDVYEHLVNVLPVHETRSSGQRRLRDALALTEYLRPTDDADEVDGPRYQFPGERQRHALIVRIFDRLAERRPVLLWLDDLHWGNEAFGVLEYLRQMREQPPAVLVVATLRSDVVSARPRLRQRLETIQSGETSVSMHLDPLSRRHQRELLEGLLPLEEQLAEQLADRTEGHPLFAMQLLGHWIDCGAIETGDEGFRLPTDGEVGMPDDIHALWRERIDRLVVAMGASGADILEALEIAAALGREVDEQEWRRVLEAAELACPPTLVERLVERGLARRSSRGWTFAHGLLVDSLARSARR
ncbi:MAG: AAA family ATPase, partial [Bradymonadaceae bacterium]